MHGSGAVGCCRMTTAGPSTVAPGMEVPQRWTQLVDTLLAEDGEFNEIFVRGSGPEKALATRTNRIRMMTQIGLNDVEAKIDTAEAGTSMVDSRVDNLEARVTTSENTIGNAFASTLSELQSQQTKTDSLIQALTTKFTELESWKLSAEKELLSMKAAGSSGSSGINRIDKPIMEYDTIQGMAKLGERKRVT